MKGKYQQKMPPIFLTTKVPHNKYEHIGKKGIRSHNANTEVANINLPWEALNITSIEQHTTTPKHQITVITFSTI